MLHDVWLPILLVAIVAALAAVAARRLHVLNRRVDEPRLRRLAWFFLLFAAAHAGLVVESLLLEASPVRARDALTVPIALFWLRHALLTGALIAAVLAVGTPPRRSTDTTTAPAAVAFTQLAHPLILLLQGLLLFYLVARSALNHAKRAEPGSLRVALGFLLLLAAHLVPFATGQEGPPPLGAPEPLVAAVLLFGTLVLAGIVHRRPAATDAPHAPRQRGEGPG